MFKTLWAYILGFIAGFMTFVQLVMGSPYKALIVAFIIVITFVLAQLINTKIHKRMKDKHYDMIKNGKVNR